MAGLAEMIGMPQVSKAIDPRRNMLLGLAAGLVGGPTWGQGLSNGFQLAAQGGALDQQAAEKAKAELKVAQQTDAFKSWLSTKRPDLVPLLDAGVSSAELFNTAMKPAEQTDYPAEYDLYKLTQTDPGFANFMTQKGGVSERSLTPTYLRNNATGEIIISQLDKSGDATPAKIPEGFSAVDPYQMAAGKTGATVDAKTAAGARAALPGAEQAVTIAKNAIGLIRNDEKGLNEQFGQVGPRNMFVLPGSALGNWTANFEQAKGQAFMQARQMLKGGGPITDYEGMKGEAAYSRMEQAARTGDKANFLLALDDFEAAVDQGYQKLVETAQGSYSQGGAAVPAAGGGNVDDILTKYGL